MRNKIEVYCPVDIVVEMRRAHEDWDKVIPMLILGYLERKRLRGQKEK